MYPGQEEKLIERYSTGRQPVTRDLERRLRDWCFKALALWLIFFSPVSVPGAQQRIKTLSFVNIPSNSRLVYEEEEKMENKTVATSWYLRVPVPSPRPKSPRALQRHKPATLFAWEFQSLINIIKGNSKQQPVKVLLIFFMPFDIEWPITVCALLRFGGGHQALVEIQHGGPNKKTTTNRRKTVLSSI